MYYQVRFGGAELAQDQQARAERLVSAIRLAALSRADLTGGMAAGRESA